MKYTAKIMKQKDGVFLVTFPGLAGCLSEGRTLEEALKNAKEALDGWLAAQIDRNFRLPKQKKVKGLQVHQVEVDAHLAFAIQLRELRRKLHLTQSQVARKLKISQQAYAKMESPFTANPSLSTIQSISSALGAHVDIRLVI